MKSIWHMPAGNNGSTSCRSADTKLLQGAAPKLSTHVRNYGDVLRNRLLTRAAPIRAATVRERKRRDTIPYFRNGALRHSSPRENLACTGLSRPTSRQNSRIHVAFETPILMSV